MSELAILRDHVPYALLPKDLLTSGLSDGAVRTWAVLASWESREFASCSSCAEERGVDEATLRSQLAELEEAGWLVRERTGSALVVRLASARLLEIAEARHG